MPKEPKTKTATKPSVAPPSGAEVKKARVAKKIDAALIADTDMQQRGLGTCYKRRQDRSIFKIIIIILTNGLDVWSSNFRKKYLFRID